MVGMAFRAVLLDATKNISLMKLQFILFRRRVIEVEPTIIGQSQSYLHRPRFLNEISKTDSYIIQNLVKSYLINSITSGEIGLLHSVHYLVDHVFTYLDEWVRFLGVFLDLTKSFDTVSISLVLHKIQVLFYRGRQFYSFSFHFQKIFRLKIKKAYFTLNKLVIFKSPRQNTKK